MEQQQVKFRPIVTTQQNSVQPTPKRTLSNMMQYSNRSFLKSDKQVPQPSNSYYSSPLLTDQQMHSIDLLKSRSRNDFMGQLNQQDPYMYKNTSPQQHQKFSQIKMSLPYLSESNMAKPQITQFSINSAQHKTRDKLHRVVPLRHDVQMLASWLDEMLLRAQVKKNPGQSGEFIEEIQDIFTLCLKELIRQISMDCLEKSVLLEKVWLQYIDIIKAIIAQAVRDRNQGEKQNLMEVKKTHQLYQVQIDNYNIMLKKERDSLAILTERFIKLKSNAKYLKRANRNINRDCKMLKYELNDLKNQKQFLTLEVDKMKDYLEEQQIMYQQQQNQIQQVLLANKFERESQVKSRKGRRAESMVYSQVPTEKKEFRVMHPTKRSKTMIGISNYVDTKKQKNALDSDSVSEDMSNLENILDDKCVDTSDIIEILELHQQQYTQTIETQQYNNSLRVDLKPDQRQQIIQTEGSFFNMKYQYTQTEILEEEVLQIENEDKEFEEWKNEIQQFSLDLQDNKQEFEINRASQIFATMAKAASKLEANLQKQRDLRTALIYENKCFLAENLKKDEDIQNLFSRNSTLRQELDEANLEIQELDNQLQFYDHVNEKMEKKYQKIKNKKLELAKKTQGIAMALTKTYQFKDIMMKKMLAKKSQQRQSNPEGNWNIQISMAEDIAVSKQQSEASIGSIKSQYDANNQSFTSAQNLTPRSRGGSAKSQRPSASKSHTQNNVTSSKQLQPQKQKRQIKSAVRRQPEKKMSTQQAPAQDAMEHLKVTIQSFLLQHKEELESDSSSDSEVSQLNYQGRLAQIRERKRFQQRQSGHIVAQAPSNNIFRVEFNNNRNNEGAVSHNMSRSTQLINQLADKYMSNPKKFGAKMQKQNVLKLISQFYVEKIKQYQMKSAPLHLICYEYYFNTYGFKNLAENKLINFYQSVFAYRDNTRIGLFGRFCMLFNPFTIDDLELYIKVLKQLDENEIAINLAQQVSDKGVLINIDRALLILDTHHQALQSETKSTIIREIRASSLDQKKVDVDYFLVKILAGYHLIRVTHKTHFEEIFFSADMDLDGMIEFQEFQKLHYHMGGQQNQNIVLIHRLFLQSCDMMSEVSGEKAMSFDRFVTFCIENNLFSESILTEFVTNISIDDPVKSIKDIELHWPRIRATFNYRLEFSNQTEYYDSILAKLDKAIHNKDKTQSLWISYRMIDEETKSIYLKKLTQDSIPIEFTLLCEVVNELLQDDNN